MFCSINGGIFLRLIILFFIFPISLYTLDFYPKEKSYSIDTTGFTGVTYGPNGNGGRLTAEIDVTDLLQNINFSLITGYGFYNNNSVLSYGRVGLQAGYNFYGDLFNLNPNIGFLLNAGIENIGLEATLTSDFEFLLYNRDLLVVRPEINYSFMNDQGISLGINLGLKRSRPMFIPVKSVSMNHSISPDIFSPDGDGEFDIMEIKLDVDNTMDFKSWKVLIFDSRNKLIKNWRGSGTVPETLKWDGKKIDGEFIESASDYTIKLYSYDYLGNVNEKITNFTSDILVIKEGDRYIINIPSIIFPPNSANFYLLDEEKQQSNKEIINNIAKKLEKFPDYKVRIEGHGNILNWHDERFAKSENEKILIPLTLSRAKSIMELLIESGVNRERLLVAGKGGSFPKVPFSDEENKWKNRRVEFILLK